MRRTILPILIICVALIGCGKRTNNTTRTDVLRYPINAEPSSFDPVTITDPESLDILQNLFEGLVMFDENNKIVPCLAEKWDISNDGLTYTFHLRPGVKFHNGRLLTSADVKWSFERCLWPDTKSPAASSYLAGIVGADDVASGKTKELKGLTVPDPQTVVIKVSKPRAFFLGELTYNTGWIFCREAVEKSGGRVDEAAAIGTGPFKLGSYMHGAKVALDAFPEYWGGKPKVSRIERSIVIDPQVRHIKYENGEVDRCEISMDDYVNDGNSPRLKDERKMQPLPAVAYLAMGQLAQPVFKDKRVRLAFAQAIDRDAIVATAYRGLSPRADGLLPPGLPGNQPDFPHIPYNPESARKLLAEAGFPGGKGFPTLALAYTQKQAEFAAAAQIIRDNLKTNLGVTVDIQERESATFLADARAKKLGFHLNTWFADYLDPQNFLSTLLRTGSAYNRVSYNNPEFDRLCDTADAETDSDKRLELYKQADKLAMSEAPLLPLVYRKTTILSKPYVKDFAVNLMGNLPQRKTYIQR